MLWYLCCCYPLQLECFAQLAFSEQFEHSGWQHNTNCLNDSILFQNVRILDLTEQTRQSDSSIKNEVGCSHTLFHLDNNAHLVNFGDPVQELMQVGANLDINHLALPLHGDGYHVIRRNGTSLGSLWGLLSRAGETLCSLGLGRGMDGGE